MPRAFIKRKTDLRAEADSLATNLVRFCAVHTENGVNRDKDRTWRRQDARPNTRKDFFADNPDGHRAGVLVGGAR